MIDYRDLPARLGKYELVEFLGGGMSHVYRATDTVIGRTVAVKILTPEGAGDEDAKGRFLQEARMAGNISHENIVNIYDFGEFEGQPFLVMEFIQGRDLHTLIKSGETGDLKRKLTLALQAARALEYIHAANIIHRDIKPENLFVNSAGKLKLIDFGIAKTPDLARTRAGYTLGTPFYMAPEQVRGAPVTKAVDIYAFGIVLFELLTGSKPFQADRTEVLFYFILEEPVDLAPLRQQDCPPELIQLIESCTAKDPAARPANFGEVESVLEKLLSGMSPMATGPVVAPPVDMPAARPTRLETPTNPIPVPIAEPTAAPSPGRSRWLAPVLAAVGGLILIAAALAVYVYLRPTSGSETGKNRRTETLAPVLATSTGEMILIPAGPFASGAKQEEARLLDYYVDKTEVTNGAYARYCRARGRPLPAGVTDDKLAYPVADITIDDAKDFARWAGKALPTMHQWEKAARGTDGRMYPWGNEADVSYANLNNAEGLWPANKAGRDISPYGVLNMGGNVAEFVDQLRNPSERALQAFEHSLTPPPTANEPWYTVRGGSFKQALPSARTYEWGAVPARYHSSSIGFRCVVLARNANRVK
jgi:serine/threonine-protein kinase